MEEEEAVEAVVSDNERDADFEPDSASTGTDSEGEEEEREKEEREYEDTQIELTDYLVRDEDSDSHGICIECANVVPWSINELVCHKRTNCNTSEEDMTFWLSFKEYIGKDELKQEESLSQEEANKNQELYSQLRMEDYMKKGPGAKRGTCKTCDTVVYWTKNNLASHKRINCPTVTTTEEKEFWDRLKKRKYKGDEREIEEDNFMKVKIFRISDYLTDINKVTRRGTCKTCQKVSIFGTRSHIAAHKRSACKISKEEREFWEKKYSRTGGLLLDKSIQQLLTSKLVKPLPPEEVKNYKELAVFKMSDYLTNIDNTTRRGNCKVCMASILCLKKNVASHKRAACNISQQEKLFWSKHYDSDAALLAQYRNRLKDESPLDDEAVNYYNIYRDLQLKDYLMDIDQGKRRGTCMDCHASVYCSKNNLTAHKRSSCTITEEEKDFWNKMKFRHKPDLKDLLENSSIEVLVDPIADTADKIACEYCHKMFSNVQSYQRHVNIHTDPFTCDICNKTFGSMVNLKGHMKNHIRNMNNEKPEHIYCGICKRVVNKGFDLKTHKLEYHNLQFPVETELGRLMTLFGSKEKQETYEEDSMLMTDDDLITQVFIKEEHPFEEREEEEIKVEKMSQEEIGGSTISEYRCCGSHFSTFTELATHESLTHPTSFRAMAESLKDLLLSILATEVPVLEPGEIVSEEKVVEDNKPSVKEQKTPEVVQRSKNTKWGRRGRIPDNYQELIGKNINIGCSVCQNQMPVFTFEDHLKYEHPFEDPEVTKATSTFVCNCCTLDFTSIADCIKHIQSADHQLEGNTCNICGGDYQDLLELNKHRAMLHSDDKARVTCDKCHQSFRRLRNLRFHMLEHKGLKSVWCKLCGARLLSEEALEKHMTIHENEQELICPHCGLGIKGSHRLRIHIKLKHKTAKTLAKEQELVNCPECKETFKGKKRLQSHIQNKHREKVLKFHCDHCGKSFQSNKHLLEHKVVHTREVKFFCTICSKGFTRKQTLTRHMTTHDDSTKSLPCTFCPKTFRTRDNLKRHLISHTGEKKQICPECEAAFADRNCLNKHMERTHGKSLPGYGEVFKQYL